MLPKGAAMSTVVFRDGVLAADTLMVQGSIKCPESMHKLARGRTHPVIYAMAGKTAALAASVRILESMPVAPWNGGEFPARLPLDGSCELVAFHRDGRIFSFETDGLWFEPAEVPFMALGSGSKAALGALHMGADAVQAVEIAALVDAYTGGPITSMRLSDIAPERHDPHDGTVARLVA
jgi:ATP-dependent protease HslVU (ClpYQ) peptidase subunit